MNITLEDFNRMADERSRRDVRIAQLESEFMTEQTRHRDAEAQLLRERDALLAETQRLQERVKLLEADFENMRFQNHWMRQFILLSVERVRNFFAHMRDYKLMSAVKAFVLDMMPPTATPEQIAYAHEVMQLPEMEDNRVITVQGNYVDIHDNGAPL